jgi:YD repeat-containing protein
VLEYLDEGHIVPGTPARPNLPRVTRHYTYPGFDQPMMEVAFLYHSTDENKGHNFLGNGASTSLEEGLDPLYNVSHTYHYGTTTELIDDVVLGEQVVRQAVRRVIRTFNRFHSLTEEKTTQNHCVKRQVTSYYAEDKPFESQVAQFQLPKEVKTIWQMDNDSDAYREEVTLTAYNEKGNQTEETQNNKVRTTYSYYPATQREGCPRDPEGFERNLKETIVYPAPMPNTGPKAAVLCTRMTYRDLKSLPGSASNGWLVPDTEILFEVENGIETELQRADSEYYETPVDEFLHGRPSRQILTLNEKVTTTEYEYSKPVSVLAGEPVLQTIETLTGFDHVLADETEPRHVKKINTLQHSLNHGEPLLTFDDNNVSIRYTYDALVRVTSETVAPDSDEVNATREYTYTLTSIRGGQAQQTMTDVKGVTTRTLFDGLNRAIYEERQDADNTTRADAYRQTYAAAYDALGNMIEESAFDWINGDATTPGADYEWPDGQSPLKLTTRFEFNDWAEPRCTIGPDGIKVFEEIDHVGESKWKDGPVQRSWRQSAGYTPTISGHTVTHLNAFEKPASVKRFIAPNDPQPFSEHLYEYDGLGRTIKETDARDAVTEYAYDHFGRMTQSILPGGAVVLRRYAFHSAEDLPIEISVNGYVLGTQTFDGLDRMVCLTTGERPQTYTYEDGQIQPATVTTALGQIRYEYKPQLGEEPWRRYLPGETGEVEAEYEYDGKNARLTLCKEEGLEVIREYYSTGEVKKEVRNQGGEPYTMLYGNSHMGRQLSYTDVLNQVQGYGYDKVGRLMHTDLGTTSSKFNYDELGRTKQIATSDKDQQVTITLDYDKFDREITRTFDLGGVKQELTQMYNEVDALVQRTLKQGEEVLRDETYGYDPRGRLTTYRCSGSQPPIDPYGNAILGQTFGFDPLDNLTRVLTTFPGGNNRADYFYENPDKTQLTKVTNSNIEANYPAVITLIYDENGNLIQDEQSRILTYDALNRLLSVSALPGETPSRFNYDPLNTLTGAGTAGNEEQRFYQNGELANQIQGFNNSTFMRGDGSVLAEHQAGAGPKS